jgi:hypothetical protein
VLSKSGREARADLRESLGLVRGSGDEAHHLVPIGLRSHELVKRAARGGFNFDDAAANGMALVFNRHRGVNIFHHNRYNNAVSMALDKQLRLYPDMTEHQAADFLLSWTDKMRHRIQRSRGRLR